MSGKNFKPLKVRKRNRKIGFLIRNKKHSNVLSRRRMAGRFFLIPRKNKLKRNK